MTRPAVLIREYRYPAEHGPAEPYHDPPGRRASWRLRDRLVWQGHTWQVATITSGHTADGNTVVLTVTRSEGPGRG